MQLAARAVFPKGEAKEDWAILRALSEWSARRCPTTPRPSSAPLMVKVAPQPRPLDPSTRGGAASIAASGGRGPQGTSHSGARSRISTHQPDRARSRMAE